MEYQNRNELVMLPKAEKDLDKIHYYLSNELSNCVAADKLIDKFIESFSRICQFPFSCPEDKTLNYRKLIVDSYIAFYKIDEQLHRVIIYRILYGMMDYEQHL